MNDETAAPPLRTLIVDDEPLAIERMQVLCAEIDAMSVIGTASDGEAALRLADKLAPDLVLLDMTMPGMDGLAVARELGRGSEPPAVIFVTAHEDFAVEAFDLDAIDYVLFDRETPFAHWLDESSGWERAYGDELAGVWVRSG